MNSLISLSSEISLLSRRSSALATGVVGMAAVFALLAATGDAQARERSSSATGPKGNTAQRDVTRSQGDVSSTTTTSTGKTASRNVDRSPGSTTATATGPNGKTATRVTTRSGTGSSQSTVTGPNGQTATRSSTVQP
jgi:cytoskeletal protein RodZ